MRYVIVTEKKENYGFFFSREQAQAWGEVHLPVSVAWSLVTV